MRPILLALRLFQYDSAHPHTLPEYCKAFLDQEHIQMLPWPVFSPNMAPTEHSQDMLVQCIHQRQQQPVTITQLQAPFVHNGEQFLNSRSCDTRAGE